MHAVNDIGRERRIKEKKKVKFGKQRDAFKQTTTKKKAET